MEGHITLSQKEIHRGQVLEQVAIGKITLKEAGQLLRVSYRQAKRLRRRYACHGGAGLAHGNRGRFSPRALPKAIRTRILELHRDEYAQYNDTHFTEALAELGIHASRETVRKVLRAASIPPKRKRRPPRYRSRRTPKEQLGMLVQWDGSPHPWFGPNYPPCSLMAAVDDATSRLLAAFFAPAETSEAYLKLIDLIAKDHGLPLAFYHDHHSALVRNDDCWSLEEQLQGRQFPTHVGRVLEELGVQSIPASSPQAKGRVERRFGVLQDRLCAELQRAHITDLDQANAWLRQYFIPAFNRRFGKKPLREGSLFRPIHAQDRFQKISFSYSAVVGNDNSVRLGGIVIDIPPAASRLSHAKKKVLVRQHLNGSWSVWAQDVKIASHPPTPLREPFRTWKPKPTKDQTGVKTALQVYIQSSPAPFLIPKPQGARS